jgi:hypothetical protein
MAAFLRPWAILDVEAEQLVKVLTDQIIASMK